MRKKLLLTTTKGLSFFSNHHNFTPKPQHLSFEVCYSVDLLNVQRRGWAYAASVPSEAPDAHKGRKRVPKHERRAMVESFVNKYFFVSFEVEALSEHFMSFPALCFILDACITAYLDF